MTLAIFVATVTTVAVIELYSELRDVLTEIDRLPDQE